MHNNLNNYTITKSRTSENICITFHNVGNCSSKIGHQNICQTGNKRPAAYIQHKSIIKNWGRGVIKRRKLVANIIFRSIVSKGSCINVGYCYSNEYLSIFTLWSNIQIYKMFKSRNIASKYNTNALYCNTHIE